MIRPELRLAPHKGSAVQCLRLASRDGARGGAPGLDPPASNMWKEKKGDNGLVFGLMKKMSNTVVTM